MSRHDDILAFLTAHLSGPFIDRKQFARLMDAALPVGEPVASPEASEVERQSLKAELDRLRREVDVLTEALSRASNPIVITQSRPWRDGALGPLPSTDIPGSWTAGPTGPLIGSDETTGITERVRSDTMRETAERATGQLRHFQGSSFPGAGLADDPGSASLLRQVPTTPPANTGVPLSRRAPDECVWIGAQHGFCLEPNPMLPAHPTGH